MAEDKECAGMLETDSVISASFDWQGMSAGKGVSGDASFVIVSRRARRCMTRVNVEPKMTRRMMVTMIALSAEQWNGRGGACGMSWRYGLGSLRQLRAKI